MTQVLTLEQWRPPRRFDDLVWTEARIEEAEDPDAGPWTAIETFTLDPVDTDPEDPAFRDFTTELASDDMDLWYRIVWVDANNDESNPTDAVQNAAPSDTYATVEELARVLKIRTPTGDQERAMSRVLLMAAGEINAEIDLDDDTDLEGWQLALAAQVNLQRASELWALTEVPLGLAGIGSEFGTTHLARNSWDKYAFTLAPLKDQWGLA